MPERSLRSATVVDASRGEQGLVKDQKAVEKDKVKVEGSNADSSQGDTRERFSKTGGNKRVPVEEGLGGTLGAIFHIEPLRGLLKYCRLYSVELFAT